jgi:hypothetical protein
LRVSSTVIPPARPARAETAASCRSGWIVVFGVDRRLHRRARPRFGLGQHPYRGAVLVQRQQRAARLAREAGVEGALEAADPDQGVGGEPLAREARQVFLGRAADFAGDVDRGAAQRVFAFLGRALGQRRPVAGQDLGPRRQLDLTFEPLAVA